MVEMMCIAETAKKMQGWGGRVELCRVKGIGMDAYTCLADMMHGLYLSRMYEPMVANHCFAVSGKSLLIIDSVERHPLELREACLCICGRMESKGFRGERFGRWWHRRRW